MKIVFPLNNHHKIGYVFIGHNGVVRFNSEFAKLFDLKQGDKWKVGYDEEDSEKSFIYFFRCLPNEEGVTMSMQNGSYLLMCKRFTDLFNATPHAYYKYEKFSYDGNDGFRVNIISNPLKPKKYSKKKIAQ